MKETLPLEIERRGGKRTSSFTPSEKLFQGRGASKWFEIPCDLQNR